MIPVERVTELLGAHRLRRATWTANRRHSDSVILCYCGWESPGFATPDAAYEAHARHQSRVLADAGLIPTTKEWAVRFTSYGKHQLITTGHRNDELWIKRYAEDLRRQEFATDVQVVTRYVGAAEWVPVGE